MKTYAKLTWFGLLFLISFGIILHPGKRQNIALAEPPLIVPMQISTNVYSPGTYFLDMAFGGNLIWGAAEESIVAINRTTGASYTFTNADGFSGRFFESILVGHDGSVWVGAVSNGGVLRYKNGVWSKFTTSHGLDSNIVRDLVVHPNGTVYVATSRSVEYFNGAGFTNVPLAPTSESYSALVFDLDNALWAGTSDAGTYRITDSSVTHFGSSQTGPGGAIRDIALDPVSGALWFALAHRGVGRWSYAGWQLFPAGQNIPDRNAISIGVTSAGVVWAGFEGTQGIDDILGRYNGAWTLYDRGDGLSQGSNIKSIETDPSGRIWFASLGFTYFDGQDFKIHSDGLIESLVWVDYGPEGTIYFGLDNFGIGVFDGAEWSRYTHRDFGTHWILGNTSIMQRLSNGDIWVRGPWEGLAHFDGVEWEHLGTADGLPSDRFRAMRADGNDLWLVSEDSIVKFDGTTWQEWADILPSDRANHLFKAGQDIWIDYDSSQEMGISHFDGDTVTTYTTADGLLANDAWLLGVGDDGRVWARTEEALNLFENGNWQNFTFGVDIPFSGIDRGAVAPDGSVWMTFNNTDVGIGIFDGMAWATFDMDDGLLTNDVTKIFIHPNGLSAFLLYSETLLEAENAGQVFLLDSLTNKQYLNVVVVDR